MSGPVSSNPNPNVQSSVPNSNTAGAGKQLTKVTKVALSILQTLADTLSTKLGLTGCTSLQGSPRSHCFPHDASKVLRQQAHLPTDPYIAFIELNSGLEAADIGPDRTYFYSNQDYDGIGEKLEKIEPIGERNRSIALFIGEGNIFGLLPSLDKHVSQVLVVDRDDKLIAYKRAELEALKNAQTLDVFHSLMIDYADLIYPGYKSVDKWFAIISLQAALGMPKLDEEQFRKMKQAVEGVRVDFLQIDIMDRRKVEQLSKAIKESKKVITVVNRTNLMEYSTPHMQMKFFKKFLAIDGFFETFQFLPIDPNAIALFGVSGEKNEKTFLVKGLNQSLETERLLIEENKKFHDKTD
jgi:hypothetical protein